MQHHQLHRPLPEISDTLPEPSVNRWPVIERMGRDILMETMHTGPLTDEQQDRLLLVLAPLPIVRVWPRSVWAGCNLADKMRQQDRSEKNGYHDCPTY